MGEIALLIAGLGLVAAAAVARVGWQAVLCYYLTPRRIRRAMAEQGVVGPPPRLLTGNLLEIASLVGSSTSGEMPEVSHDIVGRLLPHYVLWSKTFGKRFMFWYGSEPRLCLSETDMVKDLLSSRWAPATGKSWMQRQGSKHFIGEGLLMANGESWLRQRHVVAPAFMGEKLKGHHGYMVECTKEAVRQLHAAAGEGEKEVEIGEFMSRLTGDIISRTEFDSSYDKGMRIFHLLTRLQHLTAQSSRHLWIPGARFFPTKLKKELMAMKTEVDKQLMEIIQTTKDRVEIGRSSTYGKGLLAMLISETQTKRVDQFRYNLQMVMDECKTFYFAGHDTSALLLTWTIMLLATNPSWQAKAQEEIVNVCGDGGRPPTVEHLSKLTLLNMIINESLRLYPPASLLPRMAFEDLQLRDLYIPKGTSIWIPVLAIHHDKEIWGEDADEFNPQRFARKSFAQTSHFLPFASGPRNCVGQAFAMMECKTILAMLLSHFSFTISGNYRHSPVNVLTLRPKHGVQVYLHPLRRPSWHP